MKRAAATKISEHCSQDLRWQQLWRQPRHSRLSTIETQTTPWTFQDLSTRLKKKTFKGSGLDCANYTNERETCSFHFRPSVVDYHGSSAQKKLLRLYKRGPFTNNDGVPPMTEIRIILGVIMPLLLKPLESLTEWTRDRMIDDWLKDKWSAPWLTGSPQLCQCKTYRTKTIHNLFSFRIQISMDSVLFLSRALGLPSWSPPWKSTTTWLA